MMYRSFFLAGILLTGGMYAVSASAQVPNPVPNAVGSGKIIDPILRSIQELRAGGPAGEADSRKIPFRGTRWAVNTLEYINAPIRRALEYVSGVDITGVGREKIVPNELSQWKDSGASNDEIKFLQFIAPAEFYSWDGAGSSNGQQVKGASTDAQGRVLAETTQSDPGTVKSWQQGRQKLALTENPNGREIINRLNLFSRMTAFSSALQLAAPAGGVLPITKDEEKFGPDNTSASTSTDQNLDELQQSAALTTNLAEHVQNGPEAEVLSQPYADNPGAAASDPGAALPPIVSGAQDQQGVQSANLSGNGGGTGRVAELTGISPQGAAFGGQLISQALLDIAGDRARLGALGRLNNLSNGVNFFGNGSNGLNNMFGNNFSDNPFGNGNSPSNGGPQKLSDIPNQDNPPTTNSTCSAQYASQSWNVSPDVARGAAYRLGLPAATSNQNPWNTTYVEASSLVNGNVTGQNLLTGQTQTLSESDFSSTGSCVWVVSSFQNNATDAVFIEDLNGGNGGKIYLQIE